MNLSLVGAENGNIAPRAAKALQGSIGLVQELSRELRTISHLLHPPLLDEVGLASALRSYLDGFTERSKIRVDFELQEIWGASSRIWKPPFFGSFRSASRTFTVIRKARSPEFVLVVLTVRSAWKWRTKAKAFRQRSGEPWTQGARLELESGECARDSGNWAAPWKLILTAGERL